MKVSSKMFLQLALCCALVITMAFIGGCKGSDGSAGASGAAGVTGPTGSTGPVTLTNESCDICHNTGQIMDVAAQHPDPANDTLIVTITSVQNVAGAPKVNFHVDLKSLKTGSVTPYTKLTDKAADSTSTGALAGGTLSVKFADLIPASTGTNTFSTSYFEMWTSETPSLPLRPACAVDTKLDTVVTKIFEGIANPTYNTCIPSVGSMGSLTTPATNKINVTAKATGDYSLQLVTLFGAAWPGYNNADHALATSSRVAIELSTPASGFNKAVAVADFVSDATPSLIASVRQYSVISACQQCHGPLMDGAAHANSRNDLRECVFCHSALYGSVPSHAAGFMAADAADLPVFIHKIHANTFTDLDDAASLVNGNVTFPQQIQNCSICHSDPSGVTSPGDLTGLNNYKTNPTRRVCSSCHNTIDFVSGATFTGLDGVAKTHDVETATDDGAGCLACHGAGKSKDIVKVHDITPTGVNVPEYDVTLALSAPANGTNYVAGEAVDVTATLNTHGGAAVAGSLYTTASDTKGVAGGGLNTASLYVYGPRANALSILPGGAQGVKLFTSSTNTFITTDATGFKYHLIIPSTATNGTYMVRFRAADYGYVSDTNYHLESTAFTNIQIGTATVEAKLDGNACVNCHGNGTAPFHDARHAVVFNSDECVSCHDRSGGHANTLANRVHAVHSAEKTGDLAVIDWSDVTYPQSIKVCTTCHTSKSTAYKTVQYAKPCYGCHADIPGLTDHVLQNGGVLK